MLSTKGATNKDPYRKATIIFNSLPNYIKEANKNTFKKTLKTYLIDISPCNLGEL